MSWGLALKFTELPFTTTTIYHLREKIDTTHRKLQIYEDGYWNSILGFNTKWNEGLLLLLSRFSHARLCATP